MGNHINILPKVVYGLIYIISFCDTVKKEKKEIGF